MSERGSDRVTIRRKTPENEMDVLGRWGGSWWGQVRFQRRGPFSVQCLLSESCPRLEHGQVQKSNPLSLLEDPLCAEMEESHNLFPSHRDLGAGVKGMRHHPALYSSFSVFLCLDRYRQNTEREALFSSLPKGRAW